MIVVDQTLGEDALTVLTTTKHGYGKRTPVADYTRRGRGTKGMIAIQTSARNGRVVGAVLVGGTDEVLLLTAAGVLVRTAVTEIGIRSRVTQGVRLINLDVGDQLVGIDLVGDLAVAEMEPEESPMIPE